MNSYPHFPADAELVVDMHNGLEEWTGQQWNDYVDAARRNGNMVTARLVDCGTDYAKGGPVGTDVSFRVRGHTCSGWCCNCSPEQFQADPA